MYLPILTLFDLMFFFNICGNISINSYKLAVCGNNTLIGVCVCVCVSSSVVSDT